MRICGAAINRQYFACAGQALHAKFYQPVAPTPWTSYFWHSDSRATFRCGKDHWGSGRIRGSGKYGPFHVEVLRAPDFDATKSIGEVQQIFEILSSCAE